MMQEGALRQRGGAGAPPAAGALGQAEGASAHSSVCSWGLHTGPLLRLSTSLSGWPSSPNKSVLGPPLKPRLSMFCTQLK